MKETHAFQQFVGGRVLFDAYMPEIEFLESQLKDAPREYHFDDPIDPVALDRLMGSPLFRKMYGYEGLRRKTSTRSTASSYRRVFRHDGL
ncbi:MAG: hypothetical protein ACOX4A_08100 [Saccharofermentanales bacterium]